MEGNLQLTLSSTTVSTADSDLPTRPEVLVCFICLEPPTDPISTSCGHVFCWPCMYQWLQNRPKPCPVCRYTLRRDLDIIPICGAGGAREEPSNGNGRPGEIEASHNFTPPRPSNPFLVLATANTDDATGIENFHSATNEITPRSLITSYEWAVSELSHVLSIERARAHDVAIERIDLLIRENNLVQGNANLRRELQERHWQLLLVRDQKLQNESRVNELERSNFLLVREAGASQAKERLLIEKGIETRVHIARLQKQLDRANQQLPPGWRKGLSIQLVVNCLQWIEYLDPLFVTMAEFYYIDQHSKGWIFEEID